MMARAAGCLFIILLLLAAVLIGRDYVRKHPQDVPWTELELDDPIGRFTGRKLAGLSDDIAKCRALLDSVEFAAEEVPDRSDGDQCGYDDGVRLRNGELRFAPAGPVASCPVAAAMFVFREQVLQPAALRHFGQEVSAINHAGTYSCRRLYGRSEGAYSEHATANAFDITGFVLDDGSNVSVLNDWGSSEAEGAFLTEIRDGACALFATVLSPEYNEAHADHLHFDQADRGANGWRACS